MNQWRRKGPEEVGMGIKWRGAGVGEGVQEAGWEYARLDASECLVLFDLFSYSCCYLLPSSPKPQWDREDDQISLGMVSAWLTRMRNQGPIPSQRRSRGLNYNASNDGSHGRAPRAQKKVNGVMEQWDAMQMHLCTFHGSIRKLICVLEFQP